MKRAVVDLFACPNCGGQITLTNSVQEGFQDEEVKEGSLECITCQCNYPIKCAMPRFVFSESYAESFGFQWNTFPFLQLDKFMNNDLSRERFYATTEWSTCLEGQRILEVGCGSGRFSQIAADTGAEVFSFDLSTAVEAALMNNADRENLHVFQADVYRIPLRKQVFDKIFCMGVLQHCPDVKGAFMSMIPFLRKGGEIVIDVYQRHRIVPPLKYWVRPFSRLMRPQTLYRVLRATLPPLFDLKKMLSRIPAVGRPLADLIPIGPISHKPRLNYPDDELKEIKTLSAFDMLAPKYDNPQRMEDVRAWFEEAGLVDVRIRLGFNGINAKGRKPD